MFDFCSWLWCWVDGKPDICDFGLFCDDILTIYLLMPFVIWLVTELFILLLQFLKQSVADYIKGFDPSSHVSHTCWWTLWPDKLFHFGATNWKYSLKLGFFSFGWYFVSSAYCQSFPERERLQLKYCDKVHLEPYNSQYKNAAVKNVLPDPDVPRGCDATSLEYVFWEGRIMLWGFIYNWESILVFPVHLFIFHFYFCS